MLGTTTLASELDTPARPSWFELVRSELAPMPGRLNATIRIVVATAIVLVTSITLEVPFVDLSVLIVMFLTMAAPDTTARNSVFIAIAAALAIVVITLSIALTILILKFTIDYPPARLAAMALVCFVGMYVARILPSRAAGFLLAIIVFVSQAYVDLFPGGEAALRAVLWIWVAAVYAAVVTAIVNFVLLHADPGPLLRREASERLRAVARAIAAAPASEEARKSAESLAYFAEQGAAPLRKLLGLAEVRDPSGKPMHAERTARIQLLEQLVVSTALLADLTVEPSAAQRLRLSRVAAACDQFADAISLGADELRAPPPAAIEDDDQPTELSLILAELERLVRELPLAERPEADRPTHAERLVVADALTNPRYAQFALKVTLAAMFCYVAYTAVDWFGIHTCMITCVIVALGSAGATIQKSTLRLIGCAIGGALALASIVFVVPHMTSIVGLMLLIGVVAALGGWIAMGSERTSYLGLQLAFAFYLAVLQSFAPSTDVTEVRDRLVGIVFGVVVMSLVFSYVWPERSGERMTQSLVDALHRMRELAIGAGDSSEVREAAWQSLGEADSCAELFAFERQALTARGAEERGWIRRLIDLTRRVLLAQTALAQYRQTGQLEPVDSPATAARDALGHAVNDILARVAASIETGLADTAPVDLRAPLAAIGAASRAPGGDPAKGRDGEFALCEALVDRVQALQQAVRE